MNAATPPQGYLRFPHVVGHQVVFTAEDDVWLTSTIGGRALRLTADGVAVSRPRLSPDGSQLAWVSRRAGEPEVFVMPTAGGGTPRQVTFFGQAGTVVLGFAPDGRLLVASSGGAPFRSHTWGYAIDLAEGADATPQRLPYGPVNGIAISPSGPVVVGTGYLRDPAHWKRYRGGTAGRLWINPTGSGEFSELLGVLEGPKTNPIWVGDRLAFLADFEGHGNVYSVAADGGDLRRHTDHGEYYARQLAGDGSRLTYQHAGQVWLLDNLETDSQARPLDIALGSTRAGRAPKLLNAAEHLGDVRVDKVGRASAVEVRGNIVWLTHRHGPARTVAAGEGVRHRLPVVLNPAESTESTSVGYVTDADGDDAIEVAAPDGTTRRLGSGQVGRVLELVASPDGSTIAAATHDGRLLAITVADEAIRELEHNPNGDPTGLAWSPDSKWLAYSAAEQNALRSIRLCELAAGTVTDVTTQRFIDSDPVFTVDGKYLVFLSARTFDPVYDAHVFDLAFPLATRPYLVTLAAATPSPFDPELNGQADGDEADAAKDSESDKGAGDKAEHDTVKSVEVTVDLDGIADRVVSFPVRAGRLGHLLAAKTGVVWTDSPITGELGESRNPDDDVRPSLQRWDFGKRKQLELAEKVDTVAVSGDGAKLVVRDGESLKVVPADHKPSDEGEDTIEVDLSRIRLSVNPAAEWRQMAAETARLMRDHFWLEDMADIDWDAAVAKYHPVLDHIATRDDLSDVLWEINGETGSSHAYETPPAPKQDPLRRPAFLGADLTRQADGSWTVTKVIRGDNSAREARSPLTAPGVNVLAGDVITAVNGITVGDGGPAELLLGTADKPVELRVSRAAEPRSVVVTPLASEAQLRYLDWVSSRRAIVREATGGRVGYLHVPDMMSNGWAAFHRDLRVEMAHDALIVDTRDNGGGHTSQLIIEKLARKVLGWDTARHYPDEPWPDSAPRGPLVSLANEWAGSDGDIVNAAFRALELGPVIGTRTWGGVIGIDGRYSLVDGTSVTQPRYSFWFEKFGWSVENYGVDPDVVVEFPPHAWGNSEDPQLAAGIERILSDLDSRPAPPRPDLASRPSRRAPELPPRP
jgi:tricorn protease